MVGISSPFFLFKLYKMEIINNKKIKQSRYHSDVSEHNQQVIHLDKWVSDGKAYLAAANASTYSKEDYNKDTEDRIDEFISTTPPNFARKENSHLTHVVDEKIYWNKEALLLMLRSNWDEWYKFSRDVEISIADWYGCKPDYSDWREAAEAGRAKIMEMINNIPKENN